MPVNIEDWDCVNCGGQMTHKHDNRGDVAICIDCGFVEVI